MKLLKKVLILLSIATFLLAVLVVGLAFVLFVRKMSFSGLEGIDRETHSYHSLRVNKATNDTVVSFVTLINKMEEDFSFYVDLETDEYVLISKFGEDRYVCHGSCYCADEEERRMTQASVLGRGITYLLVAATSILAYDIAKNHFSEECRNEFSDSCEESLIMSSVDECESDTVVDVEGSVEDEEDEEETIDIFCRGVCLPNRFYNHNRGGPKIDLQRITKKFDQMVFEHNCVGFGLEEIHFKVRHTPMIDSLRNAYGEKGLSNVQKHMTENEQIVAYFSTNDLDVACRTGSSLNLNDWFETDIDIPNDGVVPLCVGYYELESMGIHREPYEYRDLTLTVPIGGHSYSDYNFCEHRTWILPEGEVEEELKEGYIL